MNKALPQIIKLTEYQPILLDKKQFSDTLGTILWQNYNHPIELHSPHFFNQKINYIHNNPVEANWVRNPEHYVYSSASNYVNGTGILDVDILDLGSNIGYIGM